MPEPPIEFFTDMDMAMQMGYDPSNDWGEIEAQWHFMQDDSDKEYLKGLGNAEDVGHGKAKVFPAITLHQPYASLIAAGEKQYETRHWQPRMISPGDILMIHAGKANGRQQRNQTQALETRYPDAMQKACSLHDVRSRFPFGMIVCAVRYHGAFQVESIRDDLSDKERAFGNYKDGRFAWKLEVLRVPDMPIAATGKQGIWKWEADVTTHD